MLNRLLSLRPSCCAWTGTSLLAATLGAALLVAPGLAESLSPVEQRMLGDVKYLASDELGGRGVGTPGLDRAAEYIRDQFEQAGLDVTAHEGDAFQEFSMVVGTELGSPNTLQWTGPDGQTVELTHGTDFRTCSFGGSEKFSGPVVFGGYGIDAPKQNYQDFKGIDLNDKVVIIMRRVPRQGDPHSPFAGPHGGLSRHAGLRTKLSNAQRAGAAAVLFVNDPHTVRKELEQLQEQVQKAADQVVEAAENFDAVSTSEREKWQQAREALSDAVKRLKHVRAMAEKQTGDSLMEFGYGGDGNPNAVPVAHITQEACNRLLKASRDTSLEELEAEIDKDLKPRSAVLEGWTVSGQTAVDRVRAEVKNVIGVLEGEGPRADETIVVGAHYDHLGRGGPGSLAPGSNEVHNGADDNASGTAGLIELARRLAARKEKLARRIVFIAFTGEERGLIGSARYVREPLYPLKKTIAMFNMDMIGRLEEDKLLVYGTGTAPRWQDLVKKLGEQFDFKLALKPEGFGPSDHTSFYAKQIPVLHFFSDIHSDYHRPSDDWQKVNTAGMARVVDMIEEAILRTAQTPERPEYVEIKKRATIARTGSRPYFGSIPDFGSEAEGYAITGASPGSPAAKAGLKGGDVIVRLGDQKITGLSDFDLALRKFSPGDDVEVVVQRKGKQRKFKVTLDKPR